MNMNGLCAKFNHLVHAVSELKLDIVCITETHLLPSMRSFFIQIPKYNLIRNDVAGKVAKHGVCAYVKDNILTDSVTTPLPNVLTFHVPLYDVHIIIVYRPPSNSINDNENLLSFIEQFSVGKESLSW